MNISRSACNHSFTTLNFVGQIFSEWSTLYWPRVMALLNLAAENPSCYHRNCHTNRRKPRLHASPKWAISGGPDDQFLLYLQFIFLWVPAKPLSSYAAVVALRLLRSQKPLFIIIMCTIDTALACPRLRVLLNRYITHTRGLPTYAFPPVPDPEHSRE